MVVGIRKREEFSVMKTSKRLASELILCVFLLSFCSGTNNSQAQDSQKIPSEKYSYIFVQGGMKNLEDYYIRQNISNTVHVSGVTYDSGYHLSVGYGVGVKPTPNQFGDLRYEEVVSFSVHDHTGHGLPNPRRGDYHIESGKTYALDATSNLYYDLFLSDYFTPFVGIGVSASALLDEVTVDGINLVDGNDDRRTGQFGFSGQAMAGFLVPLGNDIALTVDGRYGLFYGLLDRKQFPDETTTFSSLNIGLQLRSGSDGKDDKGGKGGKADDLARSYFDSGGKGGNDDGFVRRQLNEIENDPSMPIRCRLYKPTTNDLAGVSEKLYCCALEGRQKVRSSHRSRISRRSKSIPSDKELEELEKLIVTRANLVRVNERLLRQASEAMPAGSPSFEERRNRVTSQCGKP